MYVCILFYFILFYFILFYFISIYLFIYLFKGYQKVQNELPIKTAKTVKKIKEDNTSAISRNKRLGLQLSNCTLYAKS